MEVPKIYSGQCWEQKGGVSKRMVLMLRHVDGVLMFCRVSVGHAPNVCSEEDGTWMYSEVDMLALFSRLGYAKIGQVYLDVLEGAKHFAETISEEA